MASYAPPSKSGSTVFNKNYYNISTTTLADAITEDTADAKYLQIDGGSMVGNLYLSGQANMYATQGSIFLNNKDSSLSVNNHISLSDNMLYVKEKLLVGDFYTQSSPKNFFALYQTGTTASPGFTYFDTTSSGKVLFRHSNNTSNYIPRILMNLGYSGGGQLVIAKEDYPTTPDNLHVNGDSRFVGDVVIDCKFLGYANSTQVGADRALNYKYLKFVDPILATGGSMASFTQWYNMQASRIKVINYYGNYSSILNFDSVLTFKTTNNKLTIDSTAFTWNSQQTGNSLPLLIMNSSISNNSSISCVIGQSLGVYNYGILKYTQGTSNETHTFGIGIGSEPQLLFLKDKLQTDNTTFTLNNSSVVIKKSSTSDDKLRIYHNGTYPELDFSTTTELSNCLNFRSNSGVIAQIGNNQDKKGVLYINPENTTGILNQQKCTLINNGDTELNGNTVINGNLNIMGSTTFFTDRFKYFNGNFQMNGSVNIGTDNTTVPSYPGRIYLNGFEQPTIRMFSTVKHNVLETNTNNNPKFYSFREIALSIRDSTLVMVSATNGDYGFNSGFKILAAIPLFRNNNHTTNIIDGIEITYINWASSNKTCRINYTITYFPAE